MSTNSALGTSTNYNANYGYGRRRSNYYSAAASSTPTSGLYEQAYEAGAPRGQGAKVGFYSGQGLTRYQGTGPKRTGKNRSQRSEYAGAVSPQQCPRETHYFRSPHSRGPTQRKFLDGYVDVRGSQVDGTCARYPRDNKWWDAVAATARGQGLSAAEAAYLLKQQGIRPGQFKANLPPLPRQGRKSRRQRMASPYAGSAFL